MDDMEVDYCSTCQGLWLSNEEWHAIKQEGRRKFKENPAEIHLQDGHKTTMACPECGSRMRARMYGDTEVDVCPAGHGVWFDQGEMTTICQHLDLPDTVTRTLLNMFSTTGGQP